MDRENRKAKQERAKLIRTAPSFLSYVTSSLCQMGMARGLPPEAKLTYGVQQGQNSGQH
jgi:hypothetical protein